GRAAPALPAGAVLRRVSVRRAARVHPVVPCVLTARGAVRAVFLTPLAPRAGTGLERRPRVGVQPLGRSDAVARKARRSDPNAECGGRHLRQVSRSDAAVIAQAKAWAGL